MSNPILSIENLYKNYGATEVLKDINVAIQPGEFLVLVGPSGCGKSTLLNCIAGLEEVTSGAINIGGRNMVGVAPKDRDIAMVFQSYALYPTMTVGKNITFGMKVRALVRDPQLFLFDELLSNLDAKLRVEMRTEIKRLHSNPANMFVAGFMGSPSMNLIPAKTKKDGATTRIEIAREYSAPLILRDNSSLDLPQDVILGLRPEDIAEAGFKTGAHVQTSKCLVDVVEPAGADTFVVTHLGGKPVTARLHAETNAKPQESLDLAFDLSKVSYFEPGTGHRLS